MVATPTASVSNDTSSLETSPPAPSSSSSVVIRALQASDIPALVEAESYSQSFLDAAVHRVDWSDRKLRVFVAEDPETKRLAGHVAVGLGYPNYFPKLDDAVIRQLYLANITVQPAYRRRGIGLQLLQFLKQEAESLDVDVLRAECAKGFLVDFYGRICLASVPYRGSHDAYPESHQMLELWLKPQSVTS